MSYKYAYFCCAMLTFIDQTGKTISLKKTPERIISIVPSQSEYIWDLGLKNELAGITKFCIHPSEMFNNVERVGGTKNLNIEKIRELQPDLIIGNKEENDRSQIELLQKEFNIWMSDIYTPNDALMMMKSIGEICNKEIQAEEIIQKSKKALEQIRSIFNGEQVIYFIWRDPYMAAANHTFINSLMEHIGLKNVAEKFDRYPEISIEELRKLNPAHCLLSSEPYPFKQEHIDELKKIAPHIKITIVDGEMFSWYGSKMIQLPGYLNELKKELLNN